MSSVLMRPGPVGARVLRLSGKSAATCVVRGALAATVALTSGSAVADAGGQGDVAAIESCLDAGAGDAVARGTCKDLLAGPCLESEEGQTTVGMVRCMDREVKAWDVILNRDYQALMARLDDGQQQALRDAQRAWIAFRDADCAFPRTFFEGGTIAAPISAACVRDHTANRVIALRAWLDWSEL